MSSNPTLEANECKCSSDLSGFLLFYTGEIASRENEEGGMGTHIGKDFKPRVERNMTYF